MTVTKKMPMSLLTTAVNKLEMKGWQWEGEGEEEDKEHPLFVDPPCALMYEVSTNKTSKWGWSKQRRYWVKLWPRKCTARGYGYSHPFVLPPSPRWSLMAICTCLVPADQIPLANFVGHSFEMYRNKNAKALRVHSVILLWSYRLFRYFNGQFLVKSTKYAYIRVQRVKIIQNRYFDFGLTLLPVLTVF